VVLNTSFNLARRAIVASAADALSTFFRSGLDVLYLGNYRISKYEGQGDESVLSGAKDMFQTIVELLGLYTRGGRWWLFPWSWYCCYSPSC